MDSLKRFGCVLLKTALYTSTETDTGQKAGNSPLKTIQTENSQLRRYFFDKKGIYRPEDKKVIARYKELCYIVGMGKP